jgi:hypothetical protein
MGDRREQMTIVGPDFRLARLESGRGVNGVAGSQGNVGGGERISMAVSRNSDSVTGIRFVPLHHPNAPRAFGSASACFTPMSSLLTSFCGRLGRVVGDPGVRADYSREVGLGPDMHRITGVPNGFQR